MFGKKPEISCDDKEEKNKIKKLLECVKEQTIHFSSYWVSKEKKDFAANYAAWKSLDWSQGKFSSVEGLIKLIILDIADRESDLVKKGGAKYLRCLLRAIFMYVANCNLNFVNDTWPRENLKSVIAIMQNQYDEMLDMGKNIGFDEVKELLPKKIKDELYPQENHIERKHSL